MRKTKRLSLKKIQHTFGLYDSVILSNLGQETKPTYDKQRMRNVPNNDWSCPSRSQGETGRESEH